MTMAAGKKWIMGLALLLLLGGGAVAAWYWATRSDVAKETQVLTTPVTRGDIEETVLATGTLKPEKLVAVGAQVSGRVLNLAVSLGQAIKEGELVAEIESTSQENALRTAKASVDNLRAQRAEKEATLVQAEADRSRQAKTLARRASSQANYDLAVASVATTRAQIAALEAQIVEAEVAVETAELNLSHTKVTAPMDGTVLAIVTQEGQTVNATQSAPTIIVLGQLERMTVRVEISEVDVLKVAPGMAVRFTVLGDSKRVREAKLDAIEPAPTSITSDSALGGTSSTSSTSASAIYYNGVFTVPNPDGALRTYMTAEAKIVVGFAKDVPLVPASALGPVGPDGAYRVRVLVSDGTMEERTVTVGLNDKSRAQVLSGLEIGDKVVTGVAPVEGSGFQMRGPRMRL
ncbi:efflux RND transporter periplasmic adaptor subunit [Rhodospirillum sp. A1_3_36]|uniref:efflux RND transporter periplasmic adaptor subunit n=1 Tax=Rhodospirillum sp. A1_3_36 TaxID=3391666 RepID=UPI0039A62E45